MQPQTLSSPQLKGEVRRRCSDVPMQLNIDILYLIAEHVDPNPKTFLTLAHVSKLFYQVFTSDRIWRLFDIHNVGVGIFASHKGELYLYDRQTPLTYWGKVSQTYRPPNSLSPLSWVGFLFHQHSCIPIPDEFKYLKEPLRTKVAECLVALRPGYLKTGILTITDEAKALSVVNKCGCSLEYLSEEFRRSRKIVSAAIKTGCNKYCTDWCCLTHVGAPILFASAELQADDDLMLRAIKKSWRSLKKASLNLRSNQKVVELAVRQSPYALEWCAYQPRELVLEAVRRDGNVLRYTGYGDDFEVVMATIKSGASLQHVSARLCDNFDIIMAAVKKNPFFLSFASERLRFNQKLCFVAITRYSNTRRYRWNFIPRFVRHCINVNPWVVNYLTTIGDHDQAFIVALKLIQNGSLV